MKRAYPLLLICTALFLVLGFSSTSEAQEKTVALMWVGKASMPNDVMLGFLRKKKELAPNLEVILNRDLDDMQAAEKLFREYERSVNGIIFLRSNGAQFLAKANPKIPCFVGATNNPVELGVMKDLDAPEGNVTGVTYDIPYAKRFQIIKILFPNIKSVALITEKGHPGGVIDEKATSDECRRFGLQYHDLARATVEEIVDGMQKLAGKVDLFILANNKLALDNTTKFARISFITKTPIFAYSDRPVHNGAVAALVARNDVLGNMLAESVVDVVVKGMPVAKVPVKTDPDPEIVINEATMKALEISFSPAVMAKAKTVR
jgi:putative tryptophan/tyrosine transport system substrate-binding protein